MPRSFRPMIAASVCLLALLAVTPAGADEDAERENLARLEHELRLLTDEVLAAKQHAPALARVRFQYDDLVRDLELIRSGIADHLDAPRQPRPVKPLKGDYRR